MNEGHSALLALALLRAGDSATARPDEATDEDIEPCAQRCVFTTHTPVPAGHDQFAWDLVQRGARASARRRS